MRFCGGCTGYRITDEELDDETNDSLIHFIVCTYAWIYSTHYIIPNGPIVCIIWEENDDTKNSLIKRPRNIKKENLTKMACSIGEFYKVNY